MSFFPRLRFRRNSGTTYTEPRINLVEGDGITITLTDDPGNEEVAVEIAADGGVGPHNILSDDHQDTDADDVPDDGDVLTYDDYLGWHAAPPSDASLDYATTAELADVAAAEAAGTSDTVARGDHVHAHGTGYLPDAHHNRAHGDDAADHLYPRTILFSFSGTISTGAALAWRPTFAGSIVHVRANTTSAPTGTITVDVLKNGSSIYPSATKPTVPAGQEFGVTRVPDTTSFSADDKIQVEIENVGTDGAYLVVAIDYRRTS